MTPIRVVGAAVLRRGRCLVARRPPHTDEADRWEFPGGKIELRETAAEALSRELREELGIEIAVGQLVGRGVAERPAGLIELTVYRAALLDGEPRPLHHAELAWCDAARLATLDWATADVPVVPIVQALLEGGDPPISS